VFVIGNCLQYGLTFLSEAKSIECKMLHLVRLQPYPKILGSA
jgi:hypothetical protein